MRFLHLNHRYAPYVGGSERYMQEVSAMLARGGHLVSLVTSNASDLEYFWDAHRQEVNAPPRERLDGVDVHRVPVRHFPQSSIVFQGSRRMMGEASRLLLPPRPFELLASRLPWMPDLAQTVGRIGPVDLVHAANLGLEGMALVAQRHAENVSAPFLLTPFIHLGSASDGTAKRYVSMPHQQNLLRKASHLIVMTQIEANFLKTLGVTRERMTITGVGVSPCEVIGGDPDRFRTKLGVTGQLIGTAGVVAFEKGARESIMAVVNLRKRGHAVELVLAGPRLSRFDSWYSTLDSKSKEGIHLPGFIDASEKRDMLAALDLLIMPSRTESFGIAYLEGWINRKPVLAARSGAVPELVRDKVNGVLVEFGNVDEIGEGILRILGSPDVARSLGDAGFDLTMERYTWPNVLKGVRQAYSKALGYDVPETVHDA